jgi:hypothetical protein
MNHTPETHDGGSNARALDETIAGTGPGIPDDALAPSQDELPEPPTDAEVAAAKQALSSENPA